MKYLLALLFFYGAVTQANVIGHDVQNFNPLTSGLDFVTVHSSETLRPCTINCGLFLNFAKNSLPNFDTVTLDPTQEDDHDDSLVSSDLNVGIGLTRRWDLGLSISNVHSQDVESNVQGIEYEETGLTDIRVNTKIRFVGDYDGGLALILGASWNQTTNNPYTGKDNGPTINIQLAADTMLANRMSIGANIGYRIKDNGEPLKIGELCNTGNCVGNATEDIQPFGDQFVASLAANYFFQDWNTKLIGELYGSMPTEDAVNTSSREQTTLEAVVGLKKDFTDKFSGHLGGGFGILNGSASPDFRVYSGINYVIGPFSFCETTEKPVIAKVEEDQSPAEAILEAEAAPPEPVAEPEEPVEDEEVFVIRDVLFDTNKHFLRSEADATIRDVAEKLKRPTGFKSVTVEGHTDSRMPEDYNQALSERRANSVMKRLIELGIPEDKISAVGKGELEPIADNGNAQGRALNRRVEFRVRWR